MTTPPLLDTIAGEVTVAQEVTRSRFVATLVPVADASEVTAVLARLHRAHPGAGHHATALVLGPDGALTRSSDDGEPSGTAGAPMLAVLTGAGLSDVLAVVSRTFGGVLLGAGGLVRAYGGAVAAAVAGAERLPRRHVEELAIEVGHGAAGWVEPLLYRLVEELGLVVDGAAYTAHGAVYEVVLPAEVGIAALEQRLAAERAPVTVHHRGSAIRAVAPRR